jgi:hypothetical protein
MNFRKSIHIFIHFVKIQSIPNSIHVPVLTLLDHNSTHDSFYGFIQILSLLYFVLDVYDDLTYILSSLFFVD